MWTYLAILFSFSVVLIIFARKWYLFNKKLSSSGDESRGVNLAEEDDSSEALKKVKISKEDREEVENLCKKGESMLKVGKDEEAVKCFVQALAIDPLHEETLHKLALLYFQKQMYGAAAAAFKQLGEISNDAVHYSHLGLALYQQNNFEEAKAAYQKAVEIDPSRPQRFVSLAQVYRSLGQGHHAIVALNKALELEEENVDFLYLMADLQLALENIEESKDALRKLFDLDPSNKEAKALLREIKKIEKKTAES